MLLRVTHDTRYDYAQEVGFSPHALYLRPRETSRHRLRRFSCQVQPEARLVETLDSHDNPLIWAWFRGRSARLEIRTEFEIETLDRNPFDFLLQGGATELPFAYPAGDRFALSPYLAPPFDETQAELRRWLETRLPGGPPRDTISFLSTLIELIRSEIRYCRREEGFSQPSARTLALGSGSCRDFAVLLIEICRTHGIAARFVSGYLHDPPEGSDPPPAAMHAWVEVYLPGAGWRGLDPTRGIFCNDRFIPVAHAAQANLVTPVQGRYHSERPVASTLSVDVRVEALA